MYIFCPNANFIFNIVVNISYNFHNIKIIFNEKSIFGLLFLGTLDINLNHGATHSMGGQ